MSIETDFEAPELGEDDAERDALEDAERDALEDAERDALGGDEDTDKNGRLSFEADGDEAPAIRVALDWVELEGALENNSPELHSFLNKVTGDVIRIFRGSEDAESRLREVETNEDFLYIEPISSREQYRWMEEFIEIVEDPVLKDKLNIAIDGKGAFRRFKDVLVGYPSERERWFAKRASKLRAHMGEWLTAKRIEPTNTPPWDGEEQTDEASGGAEAGADGDRKSVV